MAGCINICTEQIIGTCIGGMTDAICGAIPHFVETLWKPLAKGIADITNAFLGK